MLELIDDCLERYLRAGAQLTTDVDVSFEAPDREWSARLTRPTVNVFLADIRRSTKRASSGLNVEMRDGVRVQQAAIPFVELGYVVTAWTTDHLDERRVLSGLLRAVIASPTIEREHLGRGWERLEEPEVWLASEDDESGSISQTVDGQIKTGINVLVRSQFEAANPRKAEPNPTGVTLQLTQAARRVAGEVDLSKWPEARGAIVKSPGDETTVNSVGQFLIRADAGDEIVLHTDPPNVASVPDRGGIRFV